MSTDWTLWIDFGPFINASFMKNMHIGARQLYNLLLLLQVLKTNRTVTASRYHCICHFLSFGEIGLLLSLAKTYINDCKYQYQRCQHQQNEYSEHLCFEHYLEKHVDLHPSVLSISQLISEAEDGRVNQHACRDDIQQATQRSIEAELTLQCRFYGVLSKLLSHCFVMLLNICIFLSVFKVVEDSTYSKLALRINFIEHGLIYKPKFILTETVVETACNPHHIFCIFKLKMVEKEMSCNLDYILNKSDAQEQVECLSTVIVCLNEDVVVEGQQDADQNEPEDVLVDLAFELVLQFFVAVQKVQIDQLRMFFNLMHQKFRLLFDLQSTHLTFTKQSKIYLILEV